MKKLMMLLAALSLAVVLAACGDDDDSADKDKDTADKDQSEQASQDMPKPDLDDIPDVVATVNGEKVKKGEFTDVYKSQFQQNAMRAQMSGEDLDQDKMKKQTAESLVGQKLLIQEANDRDYKVSDEEVDDTLKKLSEQQQQDFDSVDDFLKALEEQGDMDKEEVMSQVKAQLRTDKLIDEESGDTEPSKDELKNAYDQYKKQQKQINKQKDDDEKTEIDSFEDKKPDLKKQVEGQKEQETTQSLVKDLRDDADVSINL